MQPPVPAADQDNFHTLQAIQKEILEMIAYGEPLRVVAESLCQRIEAIAPEAICSVLTVDQSGRLHPLASPNLPQSYSDQLDGLQVGPETGSCGTAAYRGEPVLVEEIATDPLWRDFAGLVEPLGLKACWSSPIKARGGRTIGTFALYYRTRRGPSAVEALAVATCVHLCAIAIERAEAHAQIHQLAYFDALTGLPNRFHANALAEQAIEPSRRGLGLLLIDIDNLKITNDTLGHAVGDELIKEVAARIASTVAPDAACRIGGDEFMVVLPGCDRSEPLAVIAESILSRMQEAFVCNGHTLFPQVTIGGVLSGRDGTDLDTLRQNGDLALYHAKDSGRGHFVAFHQSLRTSMTKRVEVTRRVETALLDERVAAHYQPIVRLDSGEIVGLEALARIRNDDGSFTAAGYFQEAMKEPRVARRLTDVMLRQVARDMRSWLDAEIPIQHVGINVAGADFLSDDLSARIANAFAMANVPLKHIVLEVTETVLVGGRDDSVAQSVERLRAQGIRVALDDFGTGYASLTHLLTYPVDIIKIDKCFVDRLTVDPASGVIVGALIDIAKKLDIRTVAEGIETAAQADRLMKMGCTLGQGFLHYRAASAEETTRRLLAHAQRLPEPGVIKEARRGVA